MLLFWLLITWGISGSLACHKQPTPPPAPSPPPKPPTINCPKISTTFTAGKGKRSAVVNWASPSVSSGATYSQPSKKESGKEFSEGEHTVVYIAKANGLTASCMFKFHVKVARCPRLKYYNDYESQSCSLDSHIFGDKCTFLCKAGYKMKGHREINCQENGEWSSDQPTCSVMECPQPVLPKHGIKYTCTNLRILNSVCWLQCDNDDGYEATRGQWTHCKPSIISPIWSNPNMTCEDVEPPVIENCESGAVLRRTKDPNSVLTTVKWPWNTIKVTDNSDDTLPLLSNSDKFKNTLGLFNTGTQMVTFTAKDKANNSAIPCSFVVQVQSVRCDPPNLKDDYLDYTCSNLDFNEGTRCHMVCYRALNVVGSKYIECKRNTTFSGLIPKGYWDWGQFGDPPKPKPHCEVTNCDYLPSPINGAMVCDDWMLGRLCQMQCKTGYDIPSSSRAVSMYLCDVKKGKWIQDEVPDCAKREGVKSLRLKEYYYFDGTCADNKRGIKNNFIEAVGIEAPGTSCPPEWCKIDYVTVECGDESDDVGLEEFDSFDTDFHRKRRSANGQRQPLRRRRPPMRRRPSSRRRRPSRRGNAGTRRSKPQFISFDIVITADKGDQLKLVARHISRTKFQAAGRLIQATRVRVRKQPPLCRQGTKIGYFHRDTCVPCPAGSYHNVTEDECIACPLGQYQPNEGRTSCEMCPKEQTTVTIANKNQSACKDMCKPGQFSKNGVVPCIKCGPGTYQSGRNSTSCHDCEPGMTTANTGASSVGQCIPYDILMKGPVGAPIESRKPEKICDFTFAVWVKMAESYESGVKFEVHHPNVEFTITVSIATDVGINIGNHHVQVSNAVSTSWVHVGAVWSNQILTVYIDGQRNHSQTLFGASKCPSQPQSSMRVSVRGFAYVYLRDLNFWTSGRPEVMSTLAKTCDTYSKESLFTLEDMDVDGNSDISEVLPSTCLRPDVCASRPCGKNICIPEGIGYRCACKGGYSGVKCEIPPNICKDYNDLCENNSTCIATETTFDCVCLPGYRGKLCDQKIADGGWSRWMDWGPCSTSCGNGSRIRHRFCTNPPPDSDGKPCQGDDKQTETCSLDKCPECDESTLIAGKGTIPICEKRNNVITCTVKCETGLVFPEPPFQYVCEEGWWTPTRQTVSCTVPVSPIVAGINYTVVYDQTLSNHDQVRTKLEAVGRSFTCAKSGVCQISTGSSHCSDHVDVCGEHGGNYYGSLIVKKPVPSGDIDVQHFQETENPLLSPLFDTWSVFQHTSDELVTPDHRELELNVVDGNLFVSSYADPSLSVVVPGQFGKIMKTWKSLDDVNWEVRSSRYSNFSVPLGGASVEEPTYLSAVQMMECPTGAVRGGVFCMKCPPGKRYADGQCHRCRNGFYQDQPGQLTCKACPGFKTTENLGNPHLEQCIDSDVSGLKLLLGLQGPRFGVLDVKTLSLSEISLKQTQGYIDYLAFNPRDGFVYFSTQAPTVIGRIKINGVNEEVLAEFSTGTLVTGLDIDVGSGLLFYITHAGVLSVLDTGSRAMFSLLSNLTTPRSLVLDQNFGVYWVESNKIMHIKYHNLVAQPLVTEQNYAIWNPVLDIHGNRVIWLSNKRLRTANLDGSNFQTLATGFTTRFGLTKDYYFHIDEKASLMRENKDLTALTSVLELQVRVDRMKVINATVDSTVVNLCHEDLSDCDHGCLPKTKTSRQCFCAADFTLQRDEKTCRQDFSVMLNTSDSQEWRRPLDSDYSVPPSKSLRLRVKACHSPRVALAESGRRQYHIELGQRRGNVTEMSIKKTSLSGRKIIMYRKDINLLDCSLFKTFWITWKDKILRVGAGERVGKNQMMLVADSTPYSVNYVMFGIGHKSTALWQF